MVGGICRCIMTIEFCVHGYIKDAIDMYGITFKLDLYVPWLCMCICMCVCVCVCVRIHVCLCVHDTRHTHTCATHTCTYTLCHVCASH